MLATHIDAERVTKFFKEQHNVDQFSRLERVARVGVPVDVGPGGNLERELAYGNHSSADRHAIEVWEKPAGDVKTGRAVVVPVRLAGLIRGLRVNPVGVVEEKGKRRIIHDATFSNEPEGRGQGVRPVNETTYWEQRIGVPPGGRNASDSAEGSGATGKNWERKEDPHSEDGREECISAGGGGSGGGGELRVCPRGFPVRRPAAAVRVEGESWVLGGDSECHSTGAATNDPSIGDDLGRGSGGHSTCPGRSGYGGSGGTASRGLHSRGGRWWRGRGHRVGGFLHGRRGLGGGTVGTRRGEMPSAGAVAGIDSFSGHG